MKIYTRLVIDMTTDEILEESSFEYDGPVAQAKGGSQPATTPVTTTSESSVEPPPWQVPAMKDIITGAKRTTEIVKGLSNFSRVDTEDQILSNIHQGLDSSLTLLQHELKNKVTVTKDYDNSIQSIRCYPGQLNQVFMNILRNAIDAIDDKGKIIIKTKKLEEKIEISIKDNGSGMNEEVKTKIFDPFFTTKDVGKGTGLGLAISYGIVEKHGGKIEVESQEREGSEFTISLPIRD
ncbi:MAG: HAMP domain-containing histidine kinase [Bacteroidetes bacterium]|nr:HAMP domain-containing histidine kinase [Bacteroidota bacterium]